jgi:hypothetical protein
MTVLLKMLVRVGTGHSLTRGISLTRRIPLILRFSLTPARLQRPADGYRRNYQAIKRLHSRFPGVL